MVTGAVGPGGNCILPLPLPECPRPTPLLSVVRIRKEAPCALLLRIAEASAAPARPSEELTRAERCREPCGDEGLVEQREIGGRAGADPQRCRRSERRPGLHADSRPEQPCG